MFLSSGDPDMYDGALFSYKGDFLDYLHLEDMGVFTTHGYDPGVSEEKLDELRRLFSFTEKSLTDIINMTYRYRVWYATICTEREKL